MKYFEVHKYELTGQELCSRVASDGESLTLPEETGDINTRVIGFMVSELDEGGEVVDTRWYNCRDGGKTVDVAIVLEQIKKDHPAGEWQNHDW